MARKADTPCSDCGKLLYRGTGSPRAAGLWVTLRRSAAGRSSIRSGGTGSIGLGLLLPELLGSGLYRTHKSARDQRKCWSVGYGASLVGCVPSGMRSCERQVDARR
jgi:hypothetical protein